MTQGEPSEISEVTDERLSLANQKVVVLDVYGILYQVFHTLRDMSGPAGQPTGAAFGFVRDVMNILLKFQPKYIFCAFDLSGPTFRHQIDPQYKANRPPMPDDLRPQVISVRRLLDALCIARLEKEGYEADDIMATVANRASQLGAETILVTADKDARQLITDQVHLYHLRKEIRYTAKELLDEWGIRPDQVIDYQTIVGDTSDHIPGISGIGKKGASELLQRYDTLENLYAHIEEIKGKKKEYLLNGKEQTAISRQLVRLDPDVPISIDWEAGQTLGVDGDRLKALFTELGFRSLMPKITELTQQFGMRVAPITEEESLIVPGVDRHGEKISSEKPPLSSPQTEENSLREEAAPVTEKLFQTVSPSLEHLEKFPKTNAFDAPDWDPATVQYALVQTQEEFDEFLAQIRQSRVISFDTETYDIEGSKEVRPRFSRPVGFSFCFEPTRAWYIPVRGPLGTELLEETTVFEGLKPIFESGEILKIGQNIKFDQILLSNIGIELRGVFFDTMVADYLLRSGELGHNLDELAARYMNHETIKIDTLIGKGKKQISMREVPVEPLARYAGEDALIPWRLYPILCKKLQSLPELARLFTELEIPLIHTLVSLETNGIRVDTEHFQRLSESFASTIKTLEEEIRLIVKEADADEEFAMTFNLNSTQQLQRVLYQDLKLPVLSKTKTGISTDASTLLELAKNHILPEKILKYREANKLKGTYIDPIPAMIHPETGRIHASFNQVVTATGRLSSSNPNLQNIPVRTNEGKQIRQGFIPDPELGFDRIISCDYSQIELRVLTHYSQDENLRHAFENNLDVHSHVASKLFDLPIEEVTSSQRRIAKTVNFGLIYGQSAFGLASMLDISQKEAASYIKTFFATYPGIQIFFDRVLAQCQRDGYVETLLGRRRRIEGVRGPRGGQQLNMPERTAINTVIQGSAADLIKLAMVNLDCKLKEFNSPTESEPALPLFCDETQNNRGEKARMLLQIHDELLFETSATYADELAALVEKEMELGQPLLVPLKVDTEISRRWGE